MPARPDQRDLAHRTISAGKRTRAIARIALMTLVALPSVWLCIDNRRDLPADQLIIVLASTALSLLLAAALHGRWPRAVVLSLAALSALGIMEAWFIHGYGWAIDANALSLIAETNPAEAADLLGSFTGLHAFAVLLLPATLAFLACPPGSAPAPVGHWTERRLAWLTLIGIAGIYATACWLDRFGDPLVPDRTFPEAPRGQAIALRAAYPAGLILVIADYFRDRSALLTAAERTRAFRFGVAPAPPSPNRRVYLLVIGETTRADHLGINGYERDTTPLLAKRDHLVSFKRMYTAATFTRLSVPVLISRKAPNDIRATFREASIVTAFKEAGFRTLWISLQAPLGYHESPISVHAYEADKTVFLNPVDYRSRGKHDDAAIPLLREILDESAQEDTFIVFHTLGSHFRYSDRYPSNFQRFLPDRREDRPLRLLAHEDRVMLTNSYDNSIAFLDHVLDGIIGTLDSFPDIESWMMYVSDHGEALFDDCRLYSGHGQSARATHSVASVFWPSRLFRQANPALVETMIDRENSLLSTAMVFETLADLGGLNVPGRRPANSLASEPLRIPTEVSKVERDDQLACASQVSIE